MSRFENKSIPFPSGLEFSLKDGVLHAKGPKGESDFALSEDVSVEYNKDTGISFSAKGKENISKVGLHYRMIMALIQGVQTGYKKTLEIRGVGYRWAMKEANLEMQLGYSHPVQCKIPSGVSAKVDKNFLTIEGVDKQLVGETAARVRRQRPVEPYKGKGIRYVGETVILKAGKAGKK